MRLDNNEIVVDVGELNFTVFSSIIKIDLGANGNIYGTIHWENFPSSLEQLYLDSNEITSMGDCNNASIVCDMDHMYNLQYLILESNEMSGTINWQMFTNLNNLLYLTLGYESTCCVFTWICHN